MKDMQEKIKESDEMGKQKNDEHEKVLKEMSGKEYSHLKTKLADILIDELTPVGKEIQKLLEDKSHLEQILKKGKEKANIIAEENLKNIREKVGLI